MATFEISELVELVRAIIVAVGSGFSVHSHSLSLTEMTVYASSLEQYWPCTRNPFDGAVAN